MAFEQNLYDGDTLTAQLEQVHRLTGKHLEKAIADRGYRGRKTINETTMRSCRYRTDNRTFKK